jgi:mono/diheme cytochrome c family protein
MPRLTKLVPLTAIALFVAQLSQAACVPENSPKQPNQDAVARLLQAQDRCPATALDFRNLVERSGARLETTMVNFLGFHNPDDGAFFLFEIVSGKIAALNSTIERGDLLFGHFLTSDGSSLVLNTSGLLVEAIAWDPAKQLFNFYELLEVGGPQRASWFYRGDSKLILQDIEFLYRQRTAGQQPFRNQLRCSGCHVNGGLIQKELVPPHNDWWMKSRKPPLGSLTLDSTVTKIFQGLVDADELAKLVQATSRRLFASPEYRKALQSRTMQEQLRPLFCPVELNIESDLEPFDDGKPAVQIPAGFFADPRLGSASISIPRKNYEQALQQLGSRMRKPPGRTDADHAWLAPVKANSDMLMAEALVEIGVVDKEFVADVLAVDFTNPLFSPSRCGLLKLVPAGGKDFRPRFQAALKASAEPAAKLLLDNLTDPKRAANFHRQQVRDYLDACQKRASTPEAAIQWFGVLAHRRAEIDQLELSKHPRGHILESPGRIVFPSASTPPGRLDLTPACEVRPR